jgi:small subunit ribosomal protein S4e
MWPIHRKEAVWTVMPKPGPHSLSDSLPLALVVRNVLGFAKTAKEAKTIIDQEKIMVDGKIRRDERFIVGLMDVISIVGTKNSYRVLPSAKGLVLHPIDATEAAFKLCRLKDKTTVKNGNTQLDLHDGSSLLAKSDATQPLEVTSYHTLGVLKISIPEHEIVGYSKLVKGAPSLVIGGKNVGRVGKIVSIEKKQDKKRKELLVTIKDDNGNQFQTILDFVFVLGDTESLISLPEAN